jgi:superfamily II DNA or RNA helicase
MEYSKNYPGLYCLSGSLAIKSNNIYRDVVKNGSTWHLANRKSGSYTYFPQMPIYTHVIVLSPDYFNNKNDLYKLDELFLKYLKKRNLYNYYVDEKGGKEWYYDSCPISYLELKKDFLSEMNIPILAILESDPFPIRDLSQNEINEITNEDTIIETNYVSKIIVNLYTELKNKFCDIFLPGKSLRHHQDELWEIIQKMCESPEPLKYKGIIQWPTATGKTYGMIMLIILIKEYCTQHNIIYNGLLISPKNDIFKTIKREINKLSHFGITVYDGSEGKLSSLSIPINQHTLTLACHTALLSEKGLNKLPDINHIHYDEVHRITGEEFFNLLKKKMSDWNTIVLTGTSATPKTCSKLQHNKLAELFGDPLNILHKVDIHEAVRNGYIAKPRFIIKILPKLDDNATLIELFVDAVVSVFKQKGKAGKAIFYIEKTIQDVKYAYNYAIKTYPELNFYTAIDGQRTDDDFINADIKDGSLHILFACQRYREGSDIRNLELTGRLVGDVITAHILIQICGRALRIDNDVEKEGWCIIVRPSDEGTTEEDVMDSIVLEIFDFMGTNDKPLDKKDITELVKTYFGDVSISGNRCSIEETIERVQAAYLRNYFAKRTIKEKYTLIQKYNIEMNLKSKEEYQLRAGEHQKYILNPKEYFKNNWISWYDYLGIDTIEYPQTKKEWVEKCKLLEILTWDKYKQINDKSLPKNPSEMYEDYTNWDKEFELELDEEHIW